MGFFDLFRQSKNGKNGSANSSDIPESVFIEKEKPHDNSEDDANGISILFRFLDKNYESKGYDDALINPDNTHMEQNVGALRNDLERILRKLRIYYGDFIRDIEVHLATRRR